MGAVEPMELPRHCSSMQNSLVPAWPETAPLFVGSYTVWHTGDYQKTKFLDIFLIFGATARGPQEKTLRGLSRCSAELFQNLSGEGGLDCKPDSMSTANFPIFVPRFVPYLFGPFFNPFLGGPISTL